MRLRKLLSGVGLAVVTLSILSGCSSTNPKPESSSPAELAIIGTSGGKCAEGVCEKNFTIYDDGTTSEPSTDFDVAPLIDAIAESKLRELPEDPEAYCDSYVDGQDLTIKVSAWGEKVYTVCQLKAGAEDPLAIVAQDMFYKLNREIT